MAYYQYKGMNRKGQIVKGRKKGDSESQVRELLQGQGIAVKELSPLQGMLYQELAIGKKVSTKDFVLFLRQFATLLEAGITLVESTNVLAKQTNKKAFQAVLFDVEEELRSGKSFSEAAEKHPNVFSSLFINMVKAGEAGGSLDTILERLATYYEKQYATRRKVIAALTYPAVIGAVAAVVVFFLLSYIVPTFADMFASFDAELPAITSFVLHAGSWMKSWGWLLPLVLVLLAIAIRSLRSTYRSFRYYTDYVLLRLPGIGTLLQKAAIARLTRTLGSLFANSVPIMKSVAIVEKIVGNEVLAAALRKSRTALEQGESMTRPLKGSWVIPPMVTQMIEVGEKSGTLDTMLAKTADYYEAEVDASTEQIRSFIEPVLILFLAVAVGTIVAAIAVPMFQIFDNIQ
ncbi:type II secretion system F family protein [Bacillus piscicola]|uniref:type II secretion system F family protein n=1 Tax=Bacillus piscicola TaxID=1632684 RepID=UPI001F08FC56|nr:type II secretion system F family protein [Bacillus piscicola]